MQTTTSDQINDADFFKKLRQAIGQIPLLRPMLERALAMYFAMLDSRTPLWAKGTIAGALAYLILPLDLIPDFVGPIGYADDAAAIAAAWKTVDIFVHADHQRKAAEFFE